MFDLMPFERKNRNLANYFDAFEKTFFNDFPAMFPEMRTDIQDKGDHYLLQADLPGFNKEDIHINLNGNTLTITAEHNDEKEKKDKDRSFICRERKYGSYARSYDVSGINAQNISAAYNNGVLELQLPKADPKSSAGHQIEIK